MRRNIQGSSGAPLSQATLQCHHETAGYYHRPLVTTEGPLAPTVMLMRRLRAASTPSLIGSRLQLGCWSKIKLAYNGLEREFKFFKRLEGCVCMMCAPGDQRKSSNSQREQPELVALCVSGVIVQIRSSAAELWSAFGDECGNPLLRVVRAAGGNDRFSFSIELIR